MRAIISVILLSLLFTACIFNPDPPKSPAQNTPQTPAQTQPPAEQPQKTEPTPSHPEVDNHINVDTVSRKRRTMEVTKPVHLTNIDSTSVN